MGSSALSLKCGKERGAIKNLLDLQAESVSYEPKDITILELRALPAPTDLPTFPFSRRGATPDHRHSPVELRTYRVHALLLAYMHEKDDDYHLVLADPYSPGLTMVAEIPASHCMLAPYSGLVEGERQWLVSTFGAVNGLGKLKTLPVPTPVIVDGIGFFDIHDAQHNPTGSAPNGIELHPVILIQKETK